jgi:hypothetical protein
VKLHALETLSDGGDCSILTEKSLLFILRSRLLGHVITIIDLLLTVQEQSRNIILLK